MKTNQTIVVGVDYSEPSKNALKEAARIANATDSRLVCVNVIDKQVIDFWHQERNYDNKAIVDHALTGIEELVRQTIGDAHDLRVEVIIGSPYLGLTEIVIEEKADLLVLGANGCDGNTPQRVGIVASKCVRKVPCDVMLIKQAHDLPFKSLMVCMDFSETSVLAAHKACRLAVLDGAHVHLVHVYRKNPFGEGQFSSFQAPEVSEQEIVDKYQMRLTELTVSLKSAYPTVEISSILKAYMSVAKGLSVEIQEVNADMVFVGTRGESRFKDLVVGTTAERILHDSSCSVCSVKPV